MRIPTARLVKDSLRIKGRIKRPEWKGEASLADWKYNGR
jgi:hypothetical protein